VVLVATPTPVTATGTVSFYDGNTLLGTAAITGGRAALSVSFLTVGVHSLSAAYSGDLADLPASASLTLLVRRWYDLADGAENGEGSSGGDATGAGTTG
jgi:hypothetical protein